MKVWPWRITFVILLIFAVTGTILCAQNHIAGPFILGIALPLLFLVSCVLCFPVSEQVSQEEQQLWFHRDDFTDV